MEINRYSSFKVLSEKLGRRVQRLKESIYPEHFYFLRQFWNFLLSNSYFRLILEDLEQRFPEIEGEAKKVIEDQKVLFFEEEEKHVALSYFVIKELMERGEKGKEEKIALFYALDSGRDRDKDGQRIGFGEYTNIFKSALLYPLCDYLEEQLFDQKFLLGLLLKYKQKCEWFLREELEDSWQQNKSQGEKILGYHLYEYLFDEGLSFNIEPKSVSGRADLIAAQESDNPLIADAKIFNPSNGQGVAHLKDGFHQVFQYTLDYNDSFGYLIIFKTCKDKLNLSLSGQVLSIPFMNYSNKIIYFLVIDIFPYQKPASQRGKLKTHKMVEQDLFEEIEK